MPETDRPNVLYIFTDQQSATAMSCAGNSDVDTPNLDKLARRGTRFTRAYTAYPLCTPDRAAMLTGVMPHQCGVPANNFPIAEEFRPRELGRLLADGGYECGYGGKWHIPDYTIADPADHGFELVSPFGDATLTDNCLAFLRRERSRPFFLMASYDNPHNICEWHRSQNLPWGPIEERPVADCPALPANFAIPPYEPEILRIHQQNAIRAMASGTFTPDHWRRYRNAYLRLVEKVDAEIGRLLDGLAELGLEDNTLVIFSSDHGDGEGAHQWNNKQALYEESIRVPFLMAGPGVTRGATCDQLVSGGLDLLPTICDYASVETPGDLHGLSLRPLAEGTTPETWRQYVPVETQLSGMGGSPAPFEGRALIGRRDKYVCYNWGRFREQLIDLEADPGEMVNLAVSSHCRQRLAQFRERLTDWCKHTDDRFRGNIPRQGQVWL